MSKRSTAKRPRARTSAKKSTRKTATKRSSAKRVRARSKTAKRSAPRRSASRSAKKRATSKRTRTKAPSAVSSAATSVRGAMAGAVATVMKRLPGDTDALALLERDHRRLEELLKRGEATTERSAQGRMTLLETITSELTVHEMIEEKILYPALKSHPQGKDLALEGYQEHHVADVLIQELHELASDDERWGAKFKVLQENLEHHIQEEEGPMFRTARGLFSREELQGLGALMMKMQADARAGR